jgi:hypothetical protein
MNEQLFDKALDKLESLVAQATWWKYVTAAYASSAA